jgi:PAS domain S-box-containing protein
VEIAATMAFSSTALIISRLLARVRERTAEVQQTNEQLQAEIAERKLAEEKIRQSEAELQQLIDAIPQQVFVFDADWSPLFANRREREYTGLTPEEAQSKDALARIFHPEDLKKLEALRQRMLSENVPSEMEARIRGKDGQYRWFLIRDNPLRDEQGRVLRWYGTRTDIEDRKRAEEALRQSATKLRWEQSILTEAEKLTHTGAWEWDVVSGVWSFSDEWLRIHGTDRKTLTPEELIVIAHPDDRPSILQAFEEVRQGERPYNIEHRIIQQDTGKVRVVRASGKFVRDEEGKVAKVYGCAQDITEQKQAEEALHRLNRELRALSECNQSLMRANDEPTLLREICRIVCEEAGYRMAWVAYAQHDEAQSVRPAAWTGTDEGYLANLGITWADTERGRDIIGTAIRSGKTCWIKDYATDPEVAPWRESALRHGFRSAIALPLKDEHANIFGSLNIYSAQPNAFASEEIRLLEELAGDLAFGIVTLRSRAARQGAEEKVRQQEMELRQVLDLTPLLVAEFGPDRERLYANRPTLDYVGVTLEEWQSISDRFWFYHPDDRERLAADVYTGPRSEVPHEFEARFRKGDGSYRWFLFRDNPLRDEQGRITRWYFSATDIEDRKCAEEEHRARVWFLERMDRVNRAIGGTNDLEQMTGDVVNAMLSIFESDRAFLYYPCDPDAPSFEVFMERTRPEYPGARGVFPMTPETARGFQIMRASSGVVTFGPGCDYPLIGDFAKRFGHQSSIGITLYPKTGQPWVLAMQQCAYPRAWTAEERKLLEEIARRLTDSLTSLLMFRSLRESEEALMRSEAYLAEAQRLTHTGAWATDPAPEPLYWSEELFRLYGLDPQDGLPTHDQAMQHIHPEDRDKYARAFHRVIDQKVDSDVEFRTVLPDGAIRYLHGLGHPVLNARGELVEVVGTTVDITERKHAEEALRAQAALLDLTHDTVFVMDMEGVIKYWNRGAEERYGWTAEHALGKVVHDLLKTVFPGPLEEIRAEVSRTGRWEGEILHTKKDGTQVVVASRWALQRDERGAPQAILETNNDITLRKRAEEALRLSNAYNRSLIEASVDPLVTIGPDGKITDVNAATEAATGRSRGELVGTDFCDYFTEPSKARAGYEQVFREGVVRDYPLELRHRDGGVMSVLYNASVYRDESGRVTGVFAAARDITKRQRAEEALRLSNAYNRSLIEASVDPLVTIGPDGKITDVNAATEAATGRSRGELVGTDFCDYFTEPSKARAGYEQVFREGMVRDYPLELRHRDGGVMSVLYNASVYRDESGRVIGVFAAARDITERQRAEEALRESETRFRTFVDHAADALFIYDFEQGTIVDVNRQACESLGYTRQELIGTMGLAFDQNVDRAVTESIAERTAAGETVIDTHWHRRKDGTLFPVEAHTSQYWYGGRRFLLKVARDISDRLRAEAALRQSEAYLAEGQRLSHTGSWAFDVASNKYIYVSEENFRIFEMDAQEGLPNREAISRQIHPEDWDRVNESFEKSLREKVDTSSEFRIVLPSGTVKHLQVIRHPVMNDAGDVVELVGTLIDMTERKRAEQERERLRQLEADLAHIDRISMMGELAASIAHEVNQPLSGVVVNANACLRWLAGESPNLQEARETVRRIVRDGKRAGDVIARVRALATKTATAKERLDMNETAREVIALAGDELRKNRVAVRTEFAPELLPVLGDRVQLQQVVLNLVMNAVEAMSGVEERPRELIVRTQNDDAGQVRVTVQDSGVGLDPQSLERIFDAFYTTKQGGMGMGLSISRSIIQNHGGKLWAAANDGPGTSVQFTIPKYQQ